MLEICKSELEALAKFSTRKYKRCFVRSFGWYEGSGFLSIAMEYCPLGDLQRFLIERTRPPESDTREIIGQVVQGLQFMHDEGFAHRDLKPGNILIVSRPPEHDWWVKIGDMGLSKRIEEVGAATTSLKGTPGFFAPEQLGFGGIDPKMADPFKSDIWCLGEMTFRMLCGEAVFPSHNDLHGYHQGTVTFPNQRLSEIEVSEPAISFVASAMLAEPQLRLDIHQAFNHDWLAIVHNDSAVGQTDPSHPVLGPSCSEPNRDPYLGTEPSGTWSTISLPLRPSGTESTIRSPSMEGHRNSEVAPGPPSNHHATECDGNSETPRASQTIRQTTSLQVIKSTTDAKDHSHNPRSSSRTRTEHRTSRRNENPSINCCHQEESCSPNSTTTAIADPPVIHITQAGDAKEDSISDCSIELEMEGTAESMAKLIEIRNYFNDKLQPRSSYYLNGTFRDPKLRAAEYRWLYTVVMRDILFEADGISTDGNVKLRAEREVLVDRANAMLDGLEMAKKEFDEQEKKQQGVEWSEGSTRHSRPLPHQGSAGDTREKIPGLARGGVQMTERERGKGRKRVAAEERRWGRYPISTSEETSASPDPSGDDVVNIDELKSTKISRKKLSGDHRMGCARKYSGNIETAIRHLTVLHDMAGSSRGIPLSRRRRDSVSPLMRSQVCQPPATAGSSEGGSTSGSSSDDEVRDEPPLPRKTLFTNATQDVELEERKTPLKLPLIYDEVYGQPLPTRPRRPAAVKGGITGKPPGAGLPFSSVRDWVLGTEGSFPHSYIDLRVQTVRRSDS